MFVPPTKLGDAVPVPPLATGSVPETCVVKLTPERAPPNVRLPDVVTVPDKEIPLTVPVPATLVTDPVPAAAQLPSPRQNVDALADVPEFKLVTGKFPVTPVLNGRPVADVKTKVVGVPKLGVVNTGLVDKTLLPDPVLVVTPVPPESTGKAEPNVKEVK